VAVGAVVVPFAVVVLTGALWVLGRLVGSLTGGGGERGVGLVLVVWVPLVAVVVAAAWRWRHRHGDWPRIDFRPARAEDPDPDGPERRAPVLLLIEVVVGVLATVLVAWPAVAGLGDRRWVGATDAPYSAWLGWRVAESVRAGTWLPTSVPDALWPAGVDLLVTDGIGPTWLVALANLAGLGPYGAYDLVLVLGVAANLWAGRALGRVLSEDRWVALACGVAYASAPAVVAPVQAHLAFVWSFTLPLFVRAAVLAARGRPVRPWSLALLGVVAFLCSAYHLVFGLVAFAVVAVAWPGSALRRPAPWARVAASLALVAVVLSPFLVARWSFERDEVRSGATDTVRVEDAFLLSADALAVVTPPDELRLDPPGPRPSLGPEAFASLRIVFPGVLLLAGAGVALVLRRRGVGALLAAAGLLWLLGLGPGLHVGGRYPADPGVAVGSTAWLPFRLLLEVPGLANLRAPYRSTYALVAVLAGATALGLDGVRRHPAPGGTRPGWRGGAVVGGITAVGVALALLGPLPTSDLGLDDGLRQALGEADRRSTADAAWAGPGADGPRPGGDDLAGGDLAGADALVVVPFGCRMDDPRVVALQIEHRRPTLGCSTSRAATPFASELDVWADTPALASLWCGEPVVGAVLAGSVPGSGATPEAPPHLDAAAIEALGRELGVRYLLVDRLAVDPLGCPWLADGLDALLAGSAPEVEVLHDAAGWSLLDLGRPPGA
jgi:hypothetical protein